MVLMTNGLSHGRLSLQRLNKCVHTVNMCNLASL